MITPIDFVLFLESSQHLQECPVEPLDGIIARVVRSCSGLSYSQALTKVFDKSRLKIPTLVTVKMFR